MNMGTMSCSGQIARPVSAAVHTMPSAHLSSFYRVVLLALHSFLQRLFEHGLHLMPLENILLQVKQSKAVVLVGEHFV